MNSTSFQGLENQKTSESFWYKEEEEVQRDSRLVKDCKRLIEKWSFSQKNPSIGKKCTSIAKEHRARFYIMRRCVAMLVCWHKHGDS
ncbi:hypothetical protein D0Y65_041701 [Glycine soja]|uniref:Uncharacterized protein n=1 Tax=Glycine soja TaxID=3848 RepID=A0A445GWR0_GLYSO|nr:hypothetical protein D0Y65_041701 [Glycine soja]